MRSAVQRNAQALALGTLFAFIAAGCASVDRVQYPNSANPTEEVTKLEQEMELSAAAQHDVLAPKEYERAVRRLNEAKRELADEDMTEFWDELGTAKAYLVKSGQIAAVRGQRIQGALQARQKAIDSGARRYDPTKKTLGELDDSFKKNAPGLDKERVNGEVWDRAVVNYGALQVNAVREANLGEAKSLIRTAKDRGAGRFAPRTLTDAEDALNRAERAIADQPENQAAFMPLANRANELARNLVAVTATARKASGQTNEEVARDLVSRNQALAATQAELKGAGTEAEMTRRALAEREANLRGLAAANAGLRSDREWNQAIEEARAEFGEDEADVYRQGDKLLIRLKKINFNSGSAEVPPESRELLTKVTTVIEELNARNVEVQGHTDSTGSPAINKRVSKDRAVAVAEFLEEEADDVQVKAVGYGYEKPIAANKSKAGRQLNRRVDIVITPTKVGASENDARDMDDGELED